MAKRRKKRDFSIDVEVKPRRRTGRPTTTFDSRPKRERTRKARNEKAIREW